jgi:hypothetical protein
MKSRETLIINLTIDWRVLVILGVALAALALLYSASSAQGDDLSLPASSSVVSAGEARAAQPAAVAAASGAGSRRFYLSTLTRYGNAALTSCTTGYHMASMWEILDVSNLTYNADLPTSKTRDDMGSGPPSGMVGWIRTGYSSSGSSTPGTGNCKNWTSALSGDYGTAVRLTATWDTPPDPVNLWSFESFTCDINVSVWCVED